MSALHYVQFPDGHASAVKLSVAAGKEAIKQYAIKKLRKMLRPGDTIQCVLRHVSSSGMSRRIDFYITKKNEIICLTGYFADIGDYRLHAKERGLIATGCGMDMGFAVVYDVSCRIWPKGFKLPKGALGRNGDKSGFDNDGGYALKHQWI